MPFIMRHGAADQLRRSRTMRTPWTMSRGERHTESQAWPFSQMTPVPFLALAGFCFDVSRKLMRWTFRDEALLQQALAGSKMIIPGFQQGTVILCPKDTPSH